MCLYIFVRWEWFLGLGVLLAWNPTIMRGTYMLPRPPQWAGLSIAYKYMYIHVGWWVQVYIYCKVEVGNSGGYYWGNGVTGRRPELYIFFVSKI